MLERIAWIIVGLVVVVVGFFFLAAAIVAGLIIAAVFLVRLWWLNRKLQQAADSEFISTEYTVVERESLPGEIVEPDREWPPRSDQGH